MIGSCASTYPLGQVLTVSKFPALTREKSRNHTKEMQKPRVRPSWRIQVGTRREVLVPLCELEITISVKKNLDRYMYLPT